MKYRGILIKKTASQAVDTKNWRVYVSESPYIPVPIKAKNIQLQSWFDENGDDEFIPSTIYYEAIEITIDFVFKGYVSSAKSQIKSLINYLTGVPFSFYDQYYEIGRQNCRLINFSDGASIEYDGDVVIVDGIEQQPCLAKFSINLKINDPVTDITL